MTQPYSYEKIIEPERRFDTDKVADPRDRNHNPAQPRFHFRVRDADDNRIGTCYDELNALLIVEALNAYRGNVPMAWTCGHVAKAVCGQCHAELIEQANQLAADLLTADGFGT